MEPPGTAKTPESEEKTDLRTFRLASSQVEREYRRPYGPLINEVFEKGLFATGRDAREGHTCSLARSPQS